MKKNQLEFFDTTGHVQSGSHFNGPVYEKEKDLARLSGQILRVFNCMRDGVWRTVVEIAEITGDPETSISAQLRHLRKKRFGGHNVPKRRRGGENSALWEYCLKEPITQ